MSKKGKKKSRIEHSSSSPSSESSTNTDSDLSDNSHVIPNRSSNTMSHFGGYLESAYDRYKVLADDKLNISPSSEFINLAVVHKGMSKCDDKGSCIDIDGIVVPEENFVLVEGLPGVGKSTLCGELCRKWKTVESLQKYEIVLLLKLRERRVQNSSSLEDIFYHEDKKLCKEVVAEVRKREGEGILLVMDGFDEMPPEVASDQDRFIMKLIDGTCLPRATRLVSSRPSSLHLEKCFPREYRHIKILGFTDESKVKFAESAFQSEPDVLDHFKRFIFSNPVINSLMYLPVNCAIIAQVYKDIRRMGHDVMPKTMTQLYTTLILVLIRRHLIKIKRWDENSRVPKDLKRLPEDIYADLQRVSKLSFKGFLKNQLEFTDGDDVKSESFHHLGLLNEVKEIYVCEGARTSYSFLHHSIQEFLAAWYVSIIPELCRNGMTFLDRISLPSDDFLELFVRFLFGIIGSEINLFLNFRRAIVEQRELLNCLYEAQNPQIIPMLIKSSWYIIVDSPLDMYVFGYILFHAPISWKLGTSTSLDMLVSSLADHARSDRKMLGSISKLVLFSDHSTPKKLPSCVTEHMTSFYIRFILNSSIPVFSEWIFTLSDLQYVQLDYKEPCEDDYLLYQSLQSLTKLRRIQITCFGCSSRGAQELSKVIANSSTLDSITLKYTKPPCLSSVNNMFELYSVIEAVLSSSSVTSLETNFPFQISDGIKKFKIEIYTNSLSKSLSFFDIPPLEMHPLEMQRCFASLKSFAYYSGKIPLEYFINFDTFLQVSTLRDFTTILINSLHSTTNTVGGLWCSPSDYIRHSSSYRSSLSRALKRDVSVPLSSLRKSQSLDDLSTSPHPCEYYQSCPDLMEMQSLHSLHSIHPQLAKFLRYENIDISRSYGRYINTNHYKRYEREYYAVENVHSSKSFWAYLSLNLNDDDADWSDYDYEPDYDDYYTF